jgi:hypothetical protein
VRLVLIRFGNFVGISSTDVHSENKFEYLPQRLNTKNELEESSTRLVILIDANNSEAKLIEGLLAEVARFGEVTVREFMGISLRRRVHRRKRCYKSDRLFGFTRHDSFTVDFLMRRKSLYLPMPFSKY